MARNTLMIPPIIPFPIEEEDGTVHINLMFGEAWWNLRTEDSDRLVKWSLEAMKYFYPDILYERSE